MKIPHDPSKATRTIDLGKHLVEPTPERKGSYQELASFKTRHIPECPAQFIMCRYTNEACNPALVIDHALEGDRLMVASVNISGYTTPPDHILIKDWSENEGILKALLAADIIDGLPTELIPTGFVTAKLCKLTLRAQHMLKSFDLHHPEIIGADK